MTQFKHGDALLVVDLQYDFLPGGALGVENGDEVIPPINSLINQAKTAGIPIIFSRDWHPKNHCSFKEQGGPWPIHCVQGSHGAEFSREVNQPDDVIIVNKGFLEDKEAYSAFAAVTDKDQQPLPELLKQLGVKRIFIAGLALDYCVKYSVEDAAQLNLQSHVALDTTRAIAKDQVSHIIAELEQLGVIFEPTHKTTP